MFGHEHASTLWWQSNSSQALLSTFAISVIPNVLLYLIPIEYLSTPLYGIFIKDIMMSFASGGLLGDVFLHSLPELLSQDHHDGHHNHSHGHEHHKGGDWMSDQSFIGLLLLLGFSSFLAIERTAVNHHHKYHHNEEKEKVQESSVVEKKNKKKKTRSRSTSRGPDSRAASKSPAAKTDTDEDERQDTSATAALMRMPGQVISLLKSLQTDAMLNIMADSMHNFTDGLAIGASFSYVTHHHHHHHHHDHHHGHNKNKQWIGMATALSVLFHELPHEIGDFTVLVNSGMTKGQAIQTQYITAIAAFLGTFTGIYASEIGQHVRNGLIAFTCGGFVYLATRSMIPSTHSVTNDKEKKMDKQWSSVGKYQALLDLAGFWCGVMLMFGLTLLPHSH